MCDLRVSCPPAGHWATEEMNSCAVSFWLTRREIAPPLLLIKGKVKNVQFDGYRELGDRRFKRSIFNYSGSSRCHCTIKCMQL